MPHMVHCDIEPEAYGSIRIHTTGAATVILIPAKGLYDNLDTLQAQPGPNPCERAGSYLLRADASVAKKLKEVSIVVTAAVIDAKDGPVSLVTPPGYFTCVCPLSETKVAGYRKSFLSKGKAAKDNYKAAIGSDNQMIGHLFES